MERCERCEAADRKSEIKGQAHHLTGPNGIRMTLCNLCYTEFQDEVGEIVNFATYYEDEED
jgi:hypothetical protein